MSARPHEVARRAERISRSPSGHRSKKDPSSQPIQTTFGESAALCQESELSEPEAELQPRRQSGAETDSRETESRRAKRSST